GDRGSCVHRESFRLTGDDGVRCSDSTYRHVGFQRRFRSAGRRGQCGRRVAAVEGGGGDDGGEVVEAVAAMSALGDGGDGKASFVAPAVDGLAAHPEEGGDLAGGEEQLLGCGGIAHGPVFLSGGNRRRAPHGEVGHTAV